MKKLLGVLLLFVAPFALAANCPVVMKEIDDKMASASGLSAEKMEQVRQLRAEGEKLHEEGKHKESMKALEEAKGLLESA